MGVGAIVLGDEVGGGFHALVSFRTEGVGGVDVAVSCGAAGECIECEDFDMRFAVGAGRVEDVGESLLGTGNAIGGVHGREEALAEPGLFAAPGMTVPGHCRVEHPACSCAFADRA